MNYIGEHFWAAELGRGLTAFSFVFALLSTFAYYSRGDGWKTVGRLAFRVHAITLFGLIGTCFSSWPSTTSGLTIYGNTPH